MRTIRDYKPEVESLVAALVKAGAVIKGMDNGDEFMPYDGKLEPFIEELLGADDARLYVLVNGARRSLWLVYGNEPGVVVCDHTVDPVIDAVVEKHADEWEGKAQPMLEVP